MTSIVDKLERDRPLFHDDGKGGLTTWNANADLLRALEDCLAPGMQTLETGSGYSTVVFIAKQCVHTAISPWKSESDRIAEYCRANGLSLDRVEFVTRNSADHLPFMQNRELDLLFIDGAHRFPFPMVDWFYGSRLLKEGGLLIVDDTDIISCFLLLKFLEQDKHWEQVLRKGNFGVFRKRGGHDYPGDWPGQNFSRYKIDGEKTFLNIFFPKQDSQVQTKNNNNDRIGETRTPMLPENQAGTTAFRSEKKLSKDELKVADEEHSVTVTHEVPIDWTPAFNYKKLIEEEIDFYSNIKVTEDLREGGIHAQKPWVYWFRYLAEQVWKTNLEKEIVEFSNSIENPRILSLGCGYGGMELEIAALLKKPYEIVAVDINKGIFAQAIKKAQKDDLHIRFIPLDLNFIEIQEGSFDVIFALASLHHVLNLEQVFCQIYRGLKRQGRFIMLDIIGKTQVLFWKENVDFARNIVRTMPAQYTKGISDKENIIPPYSEPSDQKGMEGIRQEEIERQIYNYFDPFKIFKYNSFMRMICTHPVIGKRLDPDKQQDREYLEELFSLDLQQVENKNLRATEMFAVFTKKDSIWIDTINAEAHAHLGAHYAQQGKRDHALRHVKTALMLDQNNQAAMRQLAAMEQNINVPGIIAQSSPPHTVHRPSPGKQALRNSCSEVRKHAQQLSVIICTYNRANLLRIALESLVSQTLDKDRFEVIIIDDGSSDSTRQIVDSFAGRLPIKYFYQKNAGLAAGKNHGIYASQGEILFFFDDDDIAAPTLLDEHIKTHQKYPQEYYAVLNYTTWGPNLFITPLMHFITEVQYFLFAYPHIKHSEILDYTYFWGGRSSCKRSFLIEYGVFNPVFRFGCEDVELGYRLSKYNFQVVYNNRAISHMVRPLTFDDVCQRLIKQGKSQYVFSTLHDDMEVHKWTEVLNAEITWSKISPIYEAKVKSARELDKIVNLKLHHKLDIDDATMRLLHSAYWWACTASKIKGIMLSKEESQSH